MFYMIGMDENKDTASTNGCSGCIVTILAVCVVLVMGGSTNMAVAIMMVGGIATVIYAMQKG